MLPRLCNQSRLFQGKRQKLKVKISVKLNVAMKNTLSFFAKVEKKNLLQVSWMLGPFQDLHVLYDDTANALKVLPRL